MQLRLGLGHEIALDLSAPPTQSARYANHVDASLAKVGLNRMGKLRGHILQA
jgi:hypothetical protein